MLDFGEFQTFTLRQTSGLGWCPTYDRVYSAEVRKISETQYELEHVAFDCVLAVDSCESCPASTDCDQPLDDEVVEPYCCWGQMAPSSRSLEVAEIERLKGLFSAVQELAEPGVPPLFDTPCYGWDPCNMLALSWDSYASLDDWCAAPRISKATSEEILATLSEMAGMAPRP